MVWFCLLRRLTFVLAWSLMCAQTAFVAPVSCLVMADLWHLACAQTARSSSPRRLCDVPGSFPGWRLAGPPRRMMICVYYSICAPQSPHQKRRHRSLNDGKPSWISMNRWNASRTPAGTRFFHKIASPRSDAIRYTSCLSHSRSRASTVAQFFHKPALSRSYAIRLFRSFLFR